MASRDTESTFLDKSGTKAADLDHRKKINYNIGKYNAVVPQGKQQFDKIHLARERAKNIKWRALESLDQQLERFEMPGRCQKQEHGNRRNSPE
jgi:L-lactate dehydrogenase complex protein LldF